VRARQIAGKLQRTSLSADTREQEPWSDKETRVSARD